MVVDGSAIFSLVLGEELALQVDEALASAESVFLSAGSWIELQSVGTRRFKGRYDAVISKTLALYSVSIVPVSAEQAELARKAYRDFGLGTGHPARLNFGDCFAYSLAKLIGEPLLFVGNDFSQTDIVPALPRN